MKFDIEDLHKEIQLFFRALEKNSKYTYRIVNNIAQHEETDYLIEVDFSSISGKEYISMPFVLRDIIRDLIANARKYTEPGGHITAGVYESESYVRFVIEDNGVGIPENEINKVVDFGYRANNVKAKRTLGGGYGLSKAYYYVKKLEGRFWIESPIKTASTMIKFEIPKPNYMQN